MGARFFRSCILWIHTTSPAALLDQGLKRPATRREVEGEGEERRGTGGKKEGVAAMAGRELWAGDLLRYYAVHTMRSTLVGLGLFDVWCGTWDLRPVCMRWGEENADGGEPLDGAAAPGV